MIIDRDPGDEHAPSRWVFYPTCAIRMDGVCIGGSLAYFEACLVAPEPDHDAGDEDDYRRFIPSVDPRVGLRLWWPRC